MLSNPVPNNDAESLTVSYGTVLMYQKSKAKTVTSSQMLVDAFLVFTSIYDTAHRKCAPAVLKYMFASEHLGQILGVSRSNNFDQVARFFVRIKVPQSE